jgi:spermidine synthase
MTGCFLAGFVLLGWLGITYSERAAAVMNICIGLIAFSLQERLESFPLSEEEHTGEGILAEAIESRRILRLVLLVVGLSGMLALSYEVLWTRILVFLLGSSIYSFSMILVVYLFGLTAGSLISARLIDKSRRPLQVFGWLEVLIGLCAFAGFLLFRALPFEEYVLKAKPLEYLAKNFLCTLAIVLPPTLLMGATFPVAVRVYARSLGKLGKQTGTLYAVNTIGAVVGSFAAGFVLIPLLGSKNSLMLLILLSIAAGLLLLHLSMKSEGSASMNWVAGALVALPLAGFPFSNDLMEELSMRFLEGLPGKVVAMDEDATAAVAVVEMPNQYRFLAVNGVVMTILCTETQLMTHIPAALSPEPPRNLLTICFGMGSTFVSARRIGLEVDFVELCPYVVEVFKYFQHDESMLDEPGVGKIIADGRNYVLLSDKTYDIIVVDPPPPPWSAGTVNLYTKEFYELCKARLTADGIMVQWLPTVRDCFTEPQFKMMLRTYLEVFPHTTVWRSPNDYGVFLIGTLDRLLIDSKSFVEYFEAPAVKSDLALYSTTPITGQDVLSYFTLDEEAAWRYVGDAAIMDDDNPWIEFPLFNAGPSVAIMKPETLVSEKESRDIR